MGLPKETEVKRLIICGAYMTHHIRKTRYFDEICEDGELVAMYGYLLPYVETTHRAVESIDSKLLDMAPGVVEYEIFDTVAPAVLETVLYIARKKEKEPTDPEILIMYHDLLKAWVEAWLTYTPTMSVHMSGCFMWKPAADEPTKKAIRILRKKILKPCRKQSTKPFNMIVVTSDNNTISVEGALFISEELINALEETIKELAACFVK